MLIPIISNSSTINKPIDEQYIPDTIARTADLDFAKEQINSLDPVAFSGSYNDLTDRTHFSMYSTGAIFLEATVDYDTQELNVSAGLPTLFDDPNPYIIIFNVKEGEDTNQYAIVANGSSTQLHCEIKQNNIEFFVYNNGDGTFDLNVLKGKLIDSFRIHRSIETVKQLDDKYIPDTIARVTDIENHTQSASSITEGTFAGTVVAQASSQAPDASLLRNSKLVPEETDPVNNGEIYWIYE